MHSHTNNLLYLTTLLVISLLRAENHRPVTADTHWTAFTDTGIVTDFSCLSACLF